MSADKDKPAGSDDESLAPWERNRRVRQAELEAADARGEQLVSRYGREDSRPRFAVVGHANAKRRRR